MSSFNSELWRRRSWARYQKSLLKGDPKADSQWGDDVRGIGRLEKIIDWCAERDLNVVFCRRMGGIYLGEDKMIRISDRLTPKLQAYFLLHECGHFLIGGREKDERFGMGWHTVDDEDIKTFHHRCDVVEEEFEAWWRGWKLGSRLKLNIDKSDFDKHRIRMIKTYLRWALRVQGYGFKEAIDIDCEKFDKQS